MLPVPRARRRHEGTALHRLDHRIPPPVVALVAAVGAVAATMLVPAAGFGFPGSRALAAGLVALGVGIDLAGLLEFRRARTTVNPLRPRNAATLVTGGVYRVTRNPMYLGLAVSLTGIAAWDANVLAAAFVPLFCAYVTRFQIRPEERALRDLFDDEYDAYASRVRRWIGRA